MHNGTLSPDTFRRLQQHYETQTGYHLVLADLNGSIQMGSPDCARFPCMQSCRECREHIVSEALRTGKVCIDACKEGYVIWGLPYSVNGVPGGGLIVVGGGRDVREGQEAFRGACRLLFRMMQEEHLLPAELKALDADIEKPHRFVNRSSFIHLLKDLEPAGEAFIDCLLTADFPGAERSFSDIQKGFESAEGLPVELVKGLLGDLILRAREQFSENGIDAYACYAEVGALLEAFSAISSTADCGKVLLSLQDRFIRLARRKSKDPDELLIEKATTFMEQHVREALTRDSVARAVGLSPSHFSRLIREKKGRTFTDLLNQYRIERACKLLVRSTHTLAEIASETGFCDQSYFSKVFRRYKGLTPAGFREQHQL